MDILKNKTYIQYNYKNRYTNAPTYYNTKDERNQPGLLGNIIPTARYTLHKITTGDNLDKLALKYYNDPTFWWVIAYANNIIDAFEPLENNFKTIKIPNITDTTFGDLR